MNKIEKIEDLKARNYSWIIPWAAVELIANAEGCELTTYKCSANTWTIGWGETNGIRPGMTWTKEQADSDFNREINSYATSVNKYCTEYASPNQLGAMTSLAYNIGLGNFQKSTVLKAHNAGDNEAAARAFNLWNKAKVNGQLVPLKGLTARRAAESALYLKSEPDALTEIPVQEVQEESKLTASPINRAGVTTIAIGSVTGLSQVLDGASPMITQITSMASALSISPLMGISIVLIGAGIANVYWRYMQRKGGWA